MPAHMKSGRGGRRLQRFLNVAVCQIGGRSANGAEHVVVVTLVAELVAELAIFQQDSAYLVGFDEKTEPAIYGGAPNAWQGGAQILSGERTTLSCCGANHEAAGLSIPVPPAG